MKPRRNIKSFNNWEQYLKELNEPLYRKNQILSWIWEKGEINFENFSNLPKKLRNKLKEDFHIPSLKIKEKRISKDGTVKYLLELEDGRFIESVYIPERRRKTVCVSTQVGCPIQCLFCATGKMGFVRQLEAWEIADQVLQIQKDTKTKITNVVFMGMGEPFANYTNSIQAADIINQWIKIGARKVTISTIGISPAIREFARYPKQYKLAISLHTAIQYKREQIIPVAKIHKIRDLKDAVEFYYYKKRRFPTIEYLLIPEFNDTDEDIKSLAWFLENIPAKINVIPFNPIPNSPFRPPTKKEINRFMEKLLKLPYTVNLRKPRGRDIEAACGQLICKLNQNNLINPPE